jgi:zinc transporter ZupT
MLDRLLICGAMTAALAVFSALGVATTWSGSEGGEKRRRAQDLLTALSAGVVLSVSWVHLLADAQERLQDICTYPAANAAMLSGFLLMAALHAQTTLKDNQCRHSSSWGGNVLLLPAVPVTGPTCMDAEAIGEQEAQAQAAPGSITRFHMMEASISFHSFLIGLGIGFAQTGWRTLLVLGAALSLHQYLEGCALGAVGRRCDLSRLQWALTLAVFTLSLPAGVGCAVAVELLASFDAENLAYDWTSGLLNAFAAGPRRVALPAEAVQPILSSAQRRASAALLSGRHALAHRHGDDQPRAGQQHRVFV